MIFCANTLVDSGDACCCCFASTSAVETGPFVYSEVFECGQLCLDGGCGLNGHTDNDIRGRSRAAIGRWCVDIGHFILVRPASSYLPIEPWRLAVADAEDSTLLIVSDRTQEFESRSCARKLYIDSSECLRGKGRAR